MADNENPEGEGEQEVKLDEQVERAKLMDAIKTGLTQISRTADNTSYSYVNLNISEKEIIELYDVIPNYAHLRYLNLSINKIVDISTISSIKYLVQINASQNAIADISFLSQDGILEFLQFLNLSGNKIKKIPPIKLPRLRRLNLNENSIITAEEFQGHDNVELLEIRKNKLKNCTGLGNMLKLQELYLDENEIIDFSFLVNMPQLRKLNLGTNLIERFPKELPILPKLQYLNLSANKVPTYDEFKNVLNMSSIVELTSHTNPCSEEGGGDPKMEILMRLPQLRRCNSEDVTTEDKAEAQNILKEREEEKKRLEEEKRQAELEAQQQAEAEGQQQEGEGEKNEQENAEEEGN